MLKNRKIIKKFFGIAIASFAPIIFTSCEAPTEEKIEEYLGKISNKDILNTIELNSVREEKTNNYVIWNIEDWEIKKKEIEAIKISKPEYEDPKNPDPKKVADYEKWKKILEKDQKEIIDFVDLIITSEFLNNNALILVFDVGVTETTSFKYASFKVANGALTINAIYPWLILKETEPYRDREINGSFFDLLSFIKIPKKGLTKEAAKNLLVNKITNWKDFLQYKKNNPL